MEHITKEHITKVMNEDLTNEEAVNYLYFMGVSPYIISVFNDLDLNKPITGADLVTLIGKMYIDINKKK